MSRWGTTVADRERSKRNRTILALFEAGFSRQVIAEIVDLTPARVSQIVNSYGYGWR